MANETEVIRDHEALPVIKTTNEHRNFPPRELDYFTTKTKYRQTKTERETLRTGLDRQGNAYRIKEDPSRLGHSELLKRSRDATAITDKLGSDFVSTTHTNIAHSCLRTQMKFDALACHRVWRSGAQSLLTGTGYTKGTYHHRQLAPHIRDFVSDERGKTKSLHVIGDNFKEVFLFAVGGDAVK
ncbi:hypothetical protein CBL_12424 [Carabus blaptoides fortunei]